jgi:hypothetical protein
MAYENESLEGIRKGKVTKPGQPVPQPFRYKLDGQPKKAKAKGKTTNSVNDNKA